MCPIFIGYPAFAVSTNEGSWSEDFNGICVCRVLYFWCCIYVGEQQYFCWPPVSNGMIMGLLCQYTNILFISLLPHMSFLQNLWQNLESIWYTCSVGYDHCQCRPAFKTDEVENRDEKFFNVFLLDEYYYGILMTLQSSLQGLVAYWQCRMCHRQFSWVQFAIRRCSGYCSSFWKSKLNFTAH